MSKKLDAFLYISLYISVPMVLSLYLVACSDSEKEKPKTDTAPEAQIIRSDIPPKSVTSNEIVAQTPKTETPSAIRNADIEQSEASQSGSKSIPVPLQQFTKVDQMLSLARRSGCLACHSVDKKVVGPAWKEVAKRYRDSSEARDRLIEKVSNGGRGNWSEIVGNVAMPPYFPRVTKEDISRLVDFILSLQGD